MNFFRRKSWLVAVLLVDLVLLQAWQQPMAHVQKALDTAGVPDSKVAVVPVKGNWMVPPVRRNAIGAMATLLAQAAPETADRCRKRARDVAAKTERTARELARTFEALDTGGVQVLCNEMQETFVAWAGFEVVAAYGRPADLSVAEIHRLLAQAEAAGAALVVDNLQSGDVRVGAMMAREAGAAQVVLNNFPGARVSGETWRQAVRRNAAALKEGLEQWRESHE